MYRLRDETYEVAAISSVVPPLLPVIKSAITMLLGCRVMSVGPGVRTGLNIRIDNPSILGADLVCGAVAGHSKVRRAVYRGGSRHGDKNQRN